MTGREQTRRDAEKFLDYSRKVKRQRNLVAETWAERCLALLTELEQAEARLAKVPPLVEALRSICRTNDSGPNIEIYRAAGGGYEGLQAIAAAALAAWEHDLDSQGRSG